jgi:uncharacterized repeat protein (TIGR01451 family)
MEQLMSLRFVRRIPALLSVVCLVALFVAAPAHAAGALSVEMMNGYNLVVDSNNTSPSTYAPSSAYIGARVCNTGNADVANVTLNTGNFNAGVGSTPGVFPVFSSTGDLVHPQITNTGNYSLTLESDGTPATVDGTRYLGSLTPGQCVVQYWLISYPQCANAGGSPDAPPCATSITGSIQPTDDVSLNYDVWATTTSGPPTVSLRRSFTLRNEISAAANKIWPNTDSKVPNEYLAAIQSVIGWGTLGPDGQPLSGSNPVYPGQRVITTQGIWYDLGNVGQGFDNDGDLVPDQNAWLQPVGDAASFDADCFRMVNLYGLLIVKLKSGGELLIPFQNELYFEHIPENTGVVGLVYYQFVATDSGCSAVMTPYQEAASGFDNEKFSADFGLSNPLSSAPFGTNLVFDKTAPTSANQGAQITYTLTAPNNTGANLGAPDYGVPLVFSETIPAGTSFVAGSAADTGGTNLVEPTGTGTYTQGFTDIAGNLDPCTINYQVDPATPSTFVIRYSNTNGATWLLTEPAGVTNIQWMLFTSLKLDGGHDGTACVAPNGIYDNGTLQTSLPAGKTAVVNFRVTINAGPYVCNTGSLGFGGAGSSTSDQACTVVNGTNSISGFVYEDIGAGALYANGVKDAVGEAGIGTVTVWLYYDADGNGALSPGDIRLDAKTVQTTGGTGAFTFGTLPDGRFLIAVDKSDSDPAATSIAEVKAGWGNTTKDPGLALTTDQGALKMNETPAVVTMAVNLDLDGSDGVAANVTNVNFGFAPPLRLTKTVTNNPDANANGVADTAYDEGDLFSYSILAENRLPSVGHQGPIGCQYTMWATTGTNGSPASKAFTNPTYAWDGPNRTVASTQVTGGGLNFMDGTGFTAPTRPGNVIKVEALYMGYFSALLTDDTLSLKITSGAGNNTRTLSTGMIDSYSAEPATLDPDSAISWDVTSLKPGGGTWSWADNFSALRLEINPSKASSADQKNFFLDAIGLRITTDQNCESNSSTTLSPVPLQDDYDQTRVDFVSATPPPTSVDTATGVIKWNDVGPIEAGGSELVTVNVRARNITGTVVAPNVAQTAYDAKHVLYADGRLANDGTSSMSVTLQGKGEIRGTLWSDRNQSGWAIDNTEPVIPNVTVTLWGCVRSNGTMETTSNNKTCTATTNGNAWVALGTTVTSSSGLYEFIGLDTGFYLVEVGNTDNAPGTGNSAPFSGIQKAEPNDTQATTIVSGNTWTANGTASVCAGGCNNTWGDPNANTNALQLLNSPTGEEIVNGVNFGYYLANAVIYGNIWWDIDGDAVSPPEAGETGLAGFTVRLYNNLNVLVATTTTDANGNYSFSNLGTGTYTIRVTPPLLPNSAWAETHESTGGTSNLNDEMTVSVIAGDVSGAHRFGYTIRSSGSIGDTLFYDFNENGIQESTEGGIPNVTVFLYADYDRDGTIDGGVDELLFTTSTNASGRYLFSLLPSGSYVVKVDTTDPDFPDNVTPTADPDISAASIGDTIYFDNNGNAAQDVGEDGIPFVIVNLYSDVDSSGTLNGPDVVIASTSTNVDGKYLFTGLSAGRYFVDVDETSLPSTDLAITTTDPATVLITLAGSTSATTYLNADAGYSPAANFAIGNRIWHDVDNDGVQDPGEPGIPFVDVVITGGTVCATPCRVTTTAEGFWIKTGLTNATYSVSVDTTDTDFPRFFIVTTGTTNPRNATVAGNDLTNVDFGFRYDPGSGTSPTGTISGRMFLDLDGDLAFDVGEARASRTVNLLDENGHVVASTTTAADGTYSFTGIFIGNYSVQGIDPLGTRYSVIFVSGAQAFPNLNIIYNNTTENVADNMSSVSTDGVHPNLLQDFGYKRFLGSIGDSIFWDVDENGTQDLGEPGFSGVTVRLYEVTWTDSNNDGMFQSNEASGQSLVATTSTIADNPLTPANEGGTYIFANLDEATSGKYYLVIPDTTTLPAGATYTLIADPDTDGVPCTALPQPGIPTSLCDSQKLVVGFQFGNNYLGADFGYRAVGIGYATIGDHLWMDTDGDGLLDSGEVGIDAVTVWLDTDNNGTLNWTDGNANGVWDSGEGERWTQTDPDGYYVFTGIADGSYNLKVLTSDPQWPLGLSTTPTFEVRTGNTASRNNAVVVTVSSGAVSSIDDGDPATTDTCSSCNLNVDFGYRYPGTNALSGTVCTDDATKNGYCGATATTYSGVTTGESPIEGIQVAAYRWIDDGDLTAWSGAGVLDPGDSFTLIGTASTNSLGDYTFSNLPDNVVLVFSVAESQQLRLTTTDGNSSAEDVVKRGLFDGTTLYQSSTVTIIGRQALSIGGDADDNIRDVDYAFDGTLNGTVTYDFGDLPAVYANTLLSNSGAQHRVTSSPNSIYLGAGITTESDGTNSASASADGSDDGVQIVSTIFTPGGQASLQATASAAGWLAAWMDFNNDGDFEDAGELIIDRAVTAGLNTISFNIPASAPANSDFFSRFRIYPSRPSILASTGPALTSSFTQMSGEVEDYLFTMAIGPTLVDMFSTDGVQGKRGVTLTWQTSREIDNLGFHVYRQVPGGAMEQLNEHIITGSALVTGRRSTQARSYRFVDRKPVDGFAQYFIEDVDLNGAKKVHGPISPRVATSEAEEPPVTTEPDPTLGSLGGIFTTQPGMGVAVPAAPLPASAQLSEQWQIAAVPAVKVVVTKPGWYRVTKAQLAAAGFDAGDNGRALSVFTDGTEVPALVNAKSEGKLDAGDSIEFFGRGIDMPGTGSRVYYITARRGSGLRVKSTGSRGNSGSPAPSSFAYTFERVEKTVFFTSMVTNGDRENFYGAVLTSWPVDQSMTVANRDSSGSAQLEVAVQGVTANMQHVLQVQLNGNVVGNVRIDGRTRKVETLTVAAAQLVEGNNVVTLTATNGGEDVNVLESLRLTYPHRFRADNDALTFSVTAGTKVAVGGFTTDKITVLDVTDPMVPQVVDADVAAEQGATKSVSFATTGIGTRVLFAFAENRVMAPAQIAWDEPSTWNATTNAANLVIIANRAFTASAKALEAARDAQGIATEVVDVQNVYDEFSYGHHAPEAIRDFLKQTQKWKTAPRYVILLGDASFDPRNYIGFGSFDFVPTKLVPTAYIKAPSDDWFADFNGTGIPSLAIGRIPARTAAQAKAVVDKLVARGPSAPSGGWAQYVEIVADAPDGYPFERAANQVAATIPSAFTVDRITIGSTPSPSSAILNAFDRGSVMTNYIGHGSTELWSNGVFSSGAASALTNGNRLPFVVAMNCLNGYFHDLFTESISEALMNNANGGAIGVWASSALSGTSGQLDVNLAFSRGVFGPTPMTVGDAAILAKQATANGDVRRTWILFGDPTIRLK